MAMFCGVTRRRLIDEIGLLDKRFGLKRFEDNDFCYKAILRGYKLICAEDVFVHHFGHDTTRNWDDREHLKCSNTIADCLNKNGACVGVLHASGCNPMRVLVTYSLVGRGGDAIQVLEMVQALQNLGHHVELLGPTHLRPYDFFGAEGRLRSLVRRFPWWIKDFIELGFNRRLWRKAKRLLAKGTFDMIFHRAGIYDSVGMYLAEITDRPLIAWLDAPFPVERSFRGEGYFKGLHRQCMLMLGQRAQLIVTVSQASKDYYTELGLLEEKILVVPNGIPERLLQRGVELARQHPPFSRKEQCVIGFVGSLSRWHGVGLLLEALHELGAPEDRRWRIRIVGYGEEYPKLRAQAKELGLDSCIDWLGALPHERAFEEIAQFDIAVLPNTLPTGAPIKLFEYAALARPIIAPDLPNVRAIFDEDEMCFVSPQNPKGLAKAILELTKVPDQARVLGQKAQERVRNYTWEKIVQRILVAAGFGGDRNED